MAEIKDCRNCKYHDKKTYEEPCNTCLSPGCKAWELYEAKEEKGEES